MVLPELSGEFLLKGVGLATRDWRPQAHPSWGSQAARLLV